MKVSEIIPCKCFEIKENECDSVYDGMPVIYIDRHQKYSCVCPDCGRGLKISEFDSAYLALRNWNTMQAQLRKDGFIIL